MDSLKVSVIVPIYNAEKFLNRCIDSILRQTFADFELLLVDDGSTDNSGAICDHYAALDGRVRVFHKKNGGVSSARNVGLDNAKGEWITFVDSDDYVVDSYLFELIPLDDVDLVVSGVYFIDEKKQLMPPSAFITTQDNVHFVDEQLCYSYLRGPWAKLFKSQIIQTQALRFNTVLRVEEDTEFVLRYLFAAEVVRFMPVSLYCYNDSRSNLEWLRRYSMNAINIHIHLSYILAGLSRLKNKFHHDFALSEMDIKLSFRRLYFVYLVDNVQTYPAFIEEAKYFRQCKGVYYDKSRFREWVITVILRYFPFIAYVFLQKYR